MFYWPEFSCLHLWLLVRLFGWIQTTAEWRALSSVTWAGRRRQSRVYLLGSRAGSLVVSFWYCQKSLLSKANWTNQCSGGLTPMFSWGYSHCRWDTTYFSVSCWIQTCTISIFAWEKLLKASGLIMQCWTYLLDMKQFGNTDHYQLCQIRSLRKHG